MPDYTYTAVASSGAKTTGTISAGNEREVAAVLDARGLFPVTIAVLREAGKSRFSFGRGGVSGRHLATFYAQLADLLHAGVPLLRALELLEKQSPTCGCRGCCAKSA